MEDDARAKRISPMTAEADPVERVARAIERKMFDTEIESEALHSVYCDIARVAIEAMPSQTQGDVVAWRKFVNDEMLVKPANDHPAETWLGHRWEPLYTAPPSSAETARLSICNSTVWEDHEILKSWLAEIENEPPGVSVGGT